jgi:hypothetical protein
MKQSKVKTIQVIDFDSVEDHVRWINLNRYKSHDKRLFPAKAIKLDFRHSRFLKPYHIAPLACLIHEYQSNGFKIKLQQSANEINSYLESFGFNQFCEKGEDESYKVSKDKKTFPLWLISEAKKDSYIIQVQRYFESNHFGGQDLFVLGLYLAELMNNIFDHSNSKIPGYSFTQYNTRTATIITCVCDFGIGIPASVNNYLKQMGEQVIGDAEALEKAFELRFSAMTKPHNRGFGLDTVFKSISAIGGKLHIVSNRGIYMRLENGEIKKSVLEVNFPGTLVVITLSTRNLPPREETSEELDLI